MALKLQKKETAMESCFASLLQCAQQKPLGVQGSLLVFSSCKLVDALGLGRLSQRRRADHGNSRSISRIKERHRPDKEAGAQTKKEEGETSEEQANQQVAVAKPRASFEFDQPRLVELCDLGVQLGANKL
jgi:hypothetical protein